MALPAQDRQRSKTPTTATVHRMQPAYDFTQERRTARHDKRLQPGARLLFEDVCELSERDGYCNASQEHFAERYATDERTIRRWEKRLEAHGYLTTQQSASDGRRRRLFPQKVKSTGQKEPVPAGDTGQSVQIPDNSRREIPDNSRQALRVYTPPRGGREARAHEGREDSGDQPPSLPPAVDAYRSITGSDIIASQFGAKIHRAVGSDPEDVELWAGLVAIWTETPRWNERNVIGLLKAFAEAREARAAGSVNGAAAVDRYGKPLDLSRDIPASEVAAAIAAYPGLTAADFAERGTNARGVPMKRLSLDKRRELGVAK